MTVGAGRDNPHVGRPAAPEKWPVGTKYLSEWLGQHQSAVLKGGSMGLDSEHTEDCIDEQRKWQTEVDRYTAQWPKHCEKCDGWGGRWSRFDPSPAGVGLGPGSMEDFDPCPDCVQEGKCPRCGGQTVLQDEDYCVGCHWRADDGNTRGLPEAPECACWLMDDA